MRSQLLRDATLDPLLAVRYLVAVHDSVTSNDPDRLDGWLADNGFDETLADLKQSATDAATNDLAHWASYSTLYSGAEPVGRLLITRLGDVSLNGIPLPAAKLATQLTWPPVQGAPAGTLTPSVESDGAVTWSGTLGDTAVSGRSGRFAPGSLTAPDPAAFWAGTYLLTRESCSDVGATPELTSHVLVLGDDGSATLDGNTHPSAYSDGVISIPGQGRNVLVGRIGLTLRPEDGAKAVVGVLHLDTETVGLSNVGGWHLDLLAVHPATSTEPNQPSDSADSIEAALDTPPPPPPPVFSGNWDASYTLTVNGDSTVLVHLNVSGRGTAFTIDGSAVTVPTVLSESSISAGVNGWTYTLQFSRDPNDANHRIVSGSRNQGAGTQDQHLYGDTPKTLLEQFKGKDTSDLVFSVVGALVGVVTIGSAIYFAVKNRKDQDAVVNTFRDSINGIAAKLDTLSPDPAPPGQGPNLGYALVTEMRKQVTATTTALASLGETVTALSDKMEASSSDLADEIAELTDQVRQAGPNTAEVRALQAKIDDLRAEKAAADKTIEELKKTKEVTAEKKAAGEKHESKGKPPPA